MTAYRRGEVHLDDLNPVRGAELGGRRPVLVVQNDIDNRCSPVTIVAEVDEALLISLGLEPA